MGIQPLSTGSILKLLLFPSFCTSSRKIPFASLFYMIFCFIPCMNIYIAQGKGEARGDNPWRQLLMEAEMSCHFNHWLNVSQKYLCPLILCTLFMIFYMYIDPAGTENPWGQIFDVNRKASSLWSFVASFKNIFSLILYTSFHDLINLSSRGSGADPPGTNF